MDFAATLQSLKSLFMSKPELMQQYPDILSDLQKLEEYHQQLQFERDRLYSYIQNANDTIAVFDLEGKIIYTTDNWDRQLGYQKEDVLNQRVFESYMHPEDAPRSQAFLDSVISSKKGKTGFQYRIRHNDGSWRWHMVSLSPILNDAGEVESVVAIARCILDQKMAELQVRESEARMRVLLDTMREGVVIVDIDDHIQYANKSLCDTYGYTLDELRGKLGHQVLIIPEDQHLAVEKMEAREHGVPDEFEIRGRKKNNELIWLRISDAPLLDEEGRVIGYVGIMTDITAKHKITNALIASEEKYRRLFEDSVAGVFQSLWDDLSLSVNKAFANMFGYASPEEMVSSVTDIKKLYARPEEREELKQKLLNDGVVEHYEVELKRADGSIFWVSLYARLSKQGDGRLTMDGTCVDITESKSLKEQLLASQKMEAIGKLAGGVAHDFNNLLTVILGYTEDMLDNITPGSPLTESVEEIMKAGLKAANLIRQLLAFSRNQVIQNQEISINNLVNNLRGIISRLIGEEIEVEFQLNDDLAYVKADPGQIEQVLINMVINAKEAMPKGGKLKIRTSNQDVDATYANFHPRLQIGKYVMLSISDTGIGMDHETITHIFEPFFRTKDKCKGSGLGLASAYGIIEQAGGVIMPYSEPGKGTIMKVMLPALQIRSGASDAARIASSARGKGQKILIVE
ncbi:MAG TPA: PAS domain S-box protein, partial [Candidatus Cloacimonadota bacterium]|nr:PAS domain S-box protein [Candidatus Cloacimonadota bacterium]